MDTHVLYLNKDDIKTMIDALTVKIIFVRREFESLPEENKPGAIQEIQAAYAMREKLWTSRKLPALE